MRMKEILRENSSNKMTLPTFGVHLNLMPVIIEEKNFGIVRLGLERVLFALSYVITNVQAMEKTCTYFYSSMNSRSLGPYIFSICPVIPCSEKAIARVYRFSSIQHVQRYVSNHSETLMFKNNAYLRTIDNFNFNKTRNTDTRPRNSGTEYRFSRGLLICVLRSKVNQF